MSCKKKLSNTCGKKVNAKCVDYEGEFHANSELEFCDEPNLEEVIEDINTELDFLHAQTDLSALGDGCLEYDQAGADLTIPEALLTMEEKICELVDFTRMDETCPDCEEPCESNSEGTCCDPLIYVSQLPVQLDITQDRGVPPLSGTINTLTYGTIMKLADVDLAITEAGTYVVTADFTMQYSGGSIVASGTQTLYELRLNGTVVPFSTRYVKVDWGTPAPYINSYTVTSEVTATVGSTLELWFNVAPEETEIGQLLVASCTLTATRKRV